MTDRIKAALFLWTDDEVMKPAPRFLAMCRRQFAIGEEYALGPVEHVSSKSRAHFFVTIKNIWDSLPTPNPFPSAETFRKRALVGAGWARHSQTVLDTPADAKKFGIGLRSVDEYAVIKVSGCVVDLWIAKSIGHGAIKGDEWKDVKNRALDWAAAQVGVTRSAAEKHSKDGGAR